MRENFVIFPNSVKKITTQNTTPHIVFPLFSVFWYVMKYSFSCLRYFLNIAVSKAYMSEFWKALFSVFRNVMKRSLSCLTYFSNIGGSRGFLIELWAKKLPPEFILKHKHVKRLEHTLKFQNRNLHEEKHFLNRRYVHKIIQPIKCEVFNRWRAVF